MPDGPLDLPDGTVVVVTDRIDDEVASVGPTLPPPPEVVKKMILGPIKRNDLLDDPDWRVKLGVSRE